MRWPAAITTAVFLYLFLGALLIAQRPGLYDDEAMMAAGAVHALHNTGEFQLPHADHTWICRSQHCLPLMAEGRYIGAVKDYLCLPLFAIFGPRVAIIRGASLLLGAIGIVGIAFLLYRQASPAIAAAAAFALALNPSYATTLIFDNGAVAATMAALGLLCAAIALYATRPTAARAFFIGLAAGFGTWARANFIWLLAAGVIAYVIAYRSIRLPKHWPAIVTGGAIGGAPFLLYQVLSRGGTWQAMSMFTAPQPFAQLVRYRLFLFADTLLADGEHRRMWGGLAAMPSWQLWLFAILVAAACLVCQFMSRSAFARACAPALALLTGYMLVTRLEVAEHHMIAVVPFAAVVCVLGCAALQARYRIAWLVSAILGLVYCSSAIYWHASTLRGLHSTRGVGLWSNAVFNLGAYLDRQYSGREIKILDWGFENNVFVLTRGRLHSHDLFWADLKNGAAPRQHWLDEIRAGGVFVLGGPQAIESPAFSGEFRNALAETRPVFTRHPIMQANGALFAEVLEIQPNSIRGQPELTGVYPTEPAGWRWAKSHFAVRFPPDPGPSDPGRQRLRLTMHLFIPEPNISKLGPVTLNARIGDHALAPETYTTPGLYTFTRALDQDQLNAVSGWINFGLDKWLAPSSADPRELGIVLQDLSLTPADR